MDLANQRRSDLAASITERWGQPPSDSGIDMSLTTDAGQLIKLDVAHAYLWRHTVGQADVDGQGHANNASYVRWMDLAATEHSAALGYSLERYQSMGKAFMVRRHEIDYLAECFEGQQIVVATWPGEMHKFRAMRHHQIIRISDGQTLVRAQTNWVFVDLTTGRPTRIPADLIEAFLPDRQPN